MKVYEVEFYPVKRFLKRTQWRWKIKAINGRIVAASTESFYNKKDCEDNALSTMVSLRAHFDKEQFAHLDKVYESSCVRGNNHYVCGNKDVCEQCKVSQ